MHSQTPENQLASAEGYGESGVIRIVLDKANHIGFASSSIESILGLNYETIVGTPISALLPDFLIEAPVALSHKARMRVLRSLSGVCRYAMHANGEKIPVIVALQNNENEEGLHLPILLITPEQR